MCLCSALTSLSFVNRLSNSILCFLPNASKSFLVIFDRSFLLGTNTRGFSFLISHRITREYGSRAALALASVWRTLL